MSAVALELAGERFECEPPSRGSKRNQAADGVARPRPSA